MLRRAGVVLASVALLQAAGLASAQTLQTPQPTTQTPETPALPPAPAPTTPAEPIEEASQAPKPTTAQGQTPIKATGSVKICDLEAQPPANLPASGSPPVFWMVVPCFEEQGGHSLIDARTYVYYIQTLDNVSRPSENRWTPWSEQIEQSLIGDFRRLWNTNFLDNLAVDVQDYEFSNGVVGKVALFRMEEKERVKIVDYEGTEALNRTDIDEKLREAGTVIRLDTFLSEADIRSVEGVIRSMLAEKGRLEAKVSHSIKPMPSGPKLVHLTFNIEDGPEFKISRITFLGNEAVSDRKLRGKMEHNKQPGFFRFIGIGGGTYKEEQFEEDAQRMQSYYREEGYLKATVGQPEIRTLTASKDGQKRSIELRIPITEGRRYRIGKVDFAENKVVKEAALRPLFALEEGEYYNEKNVRDGYEKAQELYGSGGYSEFTAYPDFAFKDTEDPNAAPVAANTDESKPAIVDVTMHIEEGEQFFVNKIAFQGNTTTRDHVIRREMRLLESGVFNTEALKYSVRRLNQLGYFTPIEDQEDIEVEKTPNEKNKVDVTLSLEEQNRNQVTFGAGVSQFEGVFGQLQFQTANFMGRGETLSLMLAAGSRSANYQLSFTEPFMFDRPITAGFNIHSRYYQYIGAFTQRSTGGNLVFGFPVADFTRAFLQYSYEQISIEDLNPAYQDLVDSTNDPFLRDALLFGQDGSRVVSQITPTIRLNTIDNPIFPNSGKQLSASVDVAGIGGNVNFIKPTFEGIWFLRHTNRTSVGMRAQTEFIAPYAGTDELPIFERLWLGGEYSVRGFDYRSIGPRDAATGVVLGGNKSLLFNAEYNITIAEPVRLIFFYDAGQVRGDGETFRMDEFKTSTGTEVRFFMPVLNVPFRLIFAYNPQRDGVLDNRFEPQKEFQFRFAVGATFPN
ncbi:MAG: outer membrane protein assembly factor BamA [Luteitalea sp.]|nr:outer membrane protein assembly factor BamA [Luteitalea sp.]